MAEVIQLPKRRDDSGEFWEPFIDGTQLADRLSVGLRTVERWQSEGMPSEKFGRARRYQLGRCVEWLRGRSLPSTTERGPA